MEEKKTILASGMENDIPMFKGFWIRGLAALIDYLLILHLLQALYLTQLADTSLNLELSDLKM